MPYDKESVYDERIAPLMQEIIQVCKDEKLPMVAQFYLQESDKYGDGPMYCTTTVVPARDEMLPEAYDHLCAINDLMRHGPSGKPFVMAATITTQD